MMTGEIQGDGAVVAVQARRFLPGFRPANWRSPAGVTLVKVLLQPSHATFCLFAVRRLERSVELLAADAKDNAKPI